jgi:hypothetical protein
MRSALVAILAAAAALVAASMIGVAAAEAPTATAPVRTVSVVGVASVPIPQAAPAAEADAVYRQGMAAALGDAQGKAEFLAGKAGVTLGAVQSIAEDGGSISCRAEEAEAYAEYEGEQPDFGSGVAVRAVAPEAAARGAAKPAVKKARKKRPTRRPTAKQATAGSCKLEAQVSLTYAID